MQIVVFKWTRELHRFYLPMINLVTTSMHFLHGCKVSNIFHYRFSLPLGIWHKNSSKCCFQ